MLLVKRNLAIKITNTQPAFTCPKPTTKRQSYPKPTIKTPARRQWRRTGVFVTNSKHTPHTALVCPSPTTNTLLPAGYL